MTNRIIKYVRWLIISLPIFYQIVKENYNELKFLNHTCTLLSIECPLCHKAHPPRFYLFVRRTYITKQDENNQAVIVVIKVPRFFCENNYTNLWKSISSQKNIDNGNNEIMQYFHYYYKYIHGGFRIKDERDGILFWLDILS